MTTQALTGPALTQSDLVSLVLAELDTVPEAPKHGRYLTSQEAESIVATTIDHVQRTGSAREYVYLSGHRRRLVVSLTMIPKAETNTASCIDIGCYGYMAFWAWRHLGYSRVEGIEMCPGEPAVLTRIVEMDGERLELRVHNFDISGAEWPLEGTFDTLLFFETLEHVAHDPAGVMLNVTRRMTPASTLVVSVPNAVSYKTLQEFMTGAPPWTYWFFHPDLSHEPRHSFEYTPLFLKILLRSVGLVECAFRTITAYAEPAAVQDFVEIGRALSIEPRMFGETMIAQARKTAEGPLFRYPDCIYDGERYYSSTFPLLRERLEAARAAFMKTAHTRTGDWEKAEQRIAVLETELRQTTELNSQAVASQRETLLLCDTYRAKAEAAERRAEAAERRAEQEVADRIRLIEERAEQAVAERTRLAEERAEFRVREATAAMRETAFVCDAYRVRVEEVSERAARAEARCEEISERAARAEASYEHVVRSTFWRLSGPLRRALEPFPALRLRVRALGSPFWRACRRLVRGGP